jgi:hypothetical protein
MASWWNLLLAFCTGTSRFDKFLWAKLFLHSKCSNFAACKNLCMLVAGRRIAYMFSKVSGVVVGHILFLKGMFFFFLF